MSTISWKAVLVFAFFAVLIVAAGGDVRNKRIADRYPLGILVLGLLSLMAGFPPSLGWRLSGLIAAGLPLYAAAVLWPSSFGGGDVKLAAACGFFIGLPGAFSFLLWMLALAGAWGGILLMLGRAGRKDRLALGPFFVIGAAIVILG